ncbi:alpha/beta family hydrolase [Sneathiella glossodoripedis]|uniref:alpha/beta family hydrolase n=1 Tax=Sneathiella glossodoripedis TaxID=418853 RepID=UPI00047076B6|nr:alpha/beta family hydrolase [Sneathiella glossodoripedis]
MTDYLQNGNPNASSVLILAHGAGAPMDSPFMEYFAQNLGGESLHVIRFEFPYMQIRRKEGTKRPPDRQPKLLERWREVIADFGSYRNLIIGGKSMGGRMASLIADEMQVKGLVCLGYPFYAPGRSDKPRTEHLAQLSTPSLIVQGKRDSMGKKSDVELYELSNQISFHWCEDGDHSFKPRKASGLTEEENWKLAVAAVSEFVTSIS